MRKNIPVKKNTPQAKAATLSKKEERKKSSALKESGLKAFMPLLILLPVIFIAFFPVLDNDLTNWDDPNYLPENPLIRTLDGSSVKKIFTENYFGNYQPLHILSYAIEYHFYGLNPKGYHAVSLVMFLISCAFIYWFLLLLSNRNIAAIATALFGLNAMRVESVAWAAERKDMLYLMFLIPSLIAYVKYIQKNENYKYLFFSFLFFVLSILSKVMAASIVGPLIMLDYFYQRKFSLKLVIEKIPFVAFALWMGIRQVQATAETNTIDTSGLFSFADKLVIACRNLALYPVKLLVPVNLSAFYPYPQKTMGGPLPWEYYASIIVIIVLGILIFLSVKRTRLILFCGGFFVSTIALVLQLLPVGPTIFSERYTLVPSIAFSFLIASGIYYLIERRPASKNLIYGILGVYLVFLFYTTFKRCDVWQDSLTLWDDTLEKYPDVATALNNRGKYYGEHLQKYDEAMRDLSKSILADPNYELAYNNRGIVYSIRKQFDLAIKDFDHAIALKHNYTEAIHNRAIALANTRQYDRAIGDFTRLINENPEREESYVARGYTYMQVGKTEEALNDLNKAISINPGDGNAYLNRSQAMFYLKRYKDAASDLQNAQAFGAQPDPKYREQIEAAARQ